MSDAEFACNGAKSGQKVALHADPSCGPLCMCAGGVPLSKPPDIVLASDMVGTFVDQDCSAVKLKISCAVCENDCWFGCCYLGPVPLLPNWACRDCWCPGGTCVPKKTNTFSLQQGHFYTIVDRDTFVYHWLCFPACATYKREGVSSSKGGAPTEASHMLR